MFILHFISQNYRIGQVVRDHSKSSGPTPVVKQGHPKTLILQELIFFQWHYTICLTEIQVIYGMFSLFPEVYLSLQRKLLGNFCAIYLFYLEFYLILFHCLLISPWNKTHKLLIISSTSPFLNIAFFYQEAFLRLSQIHLPISATFWNEKLLLWTTGCISYISINLSEPLFQMWCKQWTLYSLPSLGPHNSFGQTQSGFFCHVQLFADSLDIFRYAFTCSENYFLTPYELSD